MGQPIILSTLSPDKKQWLKQRMRERNIPVTQIPIERQPRHGESSFPMSFSQERLWLMEQMGNVGSSYHLHQAIRITGNLDVNRLEQSLLLLANRHESFRTYFVVEAGVPVQYVDADASVQLQHVVVKEGEAEARLHEFKQAATLLLTQPFLLDEPPLLRVALFEFSLKEHIMVFVIHHIVSDGWSLKLLTKEWISLYNDLLAGQMSAVPPVTLDYADYALWQRGWMDKEMLEEGIIYWENKLHGIDPFLTFPTDRSRPRQMTFTGQTCRASIEGRTLEALKKLSWNEGASLFMTLLSTFNIMLSRYTGREDIVVGTPTAGRCREETESMIGCFVNNLVLRTDITDASDFREVLRRTTDTVLGALKHQEVPFEMVLDAVNPERNATYAPMFQLFFIFQQLETSLDQIQGAMCAAYELPQSSAKFDMTLEVIEHKDQLQVSLEYNSVLYSEETAEYFLENYVWLVEQLPSAIETPLLHLDTLSPREKKRLLAAAVGPGVTYPEHARLYSRIDHYVKHTPSAVALVSEGQSYTYAELMEKADRLAAYLRNTDVIRRSQRIGICVAPSLLLAAGILGILKSGCTYVPLDPEFPAQRLQYIVHHAELDCILVESFSLAEQFNGLKCVEIGKESACWLDLGYTYQEPEAKHIHPAYIIYTSGSTGQPKGVSITHQNAVHFLFSMQQLLQVTPEDCLMSVTTPSFDIFMLELFLPLSFGATVIFPAQGSAGDASLLLREIDHYAPSFMQATPVLWHMLIMAGWRGSDTMTLLCGGEELKVDLAAELLQRGKNVWNLYGPTETTVWSVAHRLLTPTKDSYRIVPIGRPIGRTTCFILGEDHQLLPMGAEGNLYIGGDGVSPGYYRQEELTSRKFINNRILQSDQDRLFHTGDRARLLPDGNIVYIGRMDQQLKLRGFRIEPAEIEQQLSTEPEVAGSVIVATNDTGRDRILVAYFVAATIGNVSFERIREWKRKLCEVLPIYMIPDRFIQLRELPLKPNKKVDRNALAKLRLPNDNYASGYKAPIDKTERQLVVLWERVLDRSPIGTEDHFFDLGGNSLSAVKLLTEINKEMGIALTLRQLLHSLTISGIASFIHDKEKEIDADGRAARSDSMPHYVASSERAHDVFPLTEVQMAYWAGRQVDHTLSNVSTHVYQEMDFEDLNLEHLECCFQQLVKRHPMLRAIIQSDGMQQILEEVPHYKIETIQACVCTDQDRLLLLDEIRQQLSHYVHPGTWPMFVIKAVQLPDRITRLHISIDLMIADARSFQIILNDLARLYAGYGPLWELNASFRDYVTSLLTINSLEFYKSSQDYWLERIDQFPAGPVLPLVRGINMSMHKPIFRRWKAVLDRDVWGRLCEQARRQSLTQSAMLLGAFAEVLALYSKYPHFSLNLTLFNRLPIHSDLDEVVGDFTTISLLEVDYRARDSFARRVQAVQNRLWSDLDHRLYSGIRMTEQLLRRGMITEPVPVVFTSLLDMARESSADISFDHVFKRCNEEVTEARSISQTAQVWLDHQVVERNGELHFNWDVIDDLFPSGMVDEMFEVYRTFLHSLATTTELWEEALPLSSFPSINCRHRLKLKEIEALHHSELVRQDVLLHEGFERMAVRKPEAVAVVAHDYTLSYRELNLYAIEAAHKLQRCGIEAGTLVGIVMHKGWEQLVAVLSILKVGAAYLPIDASLPERRIRELLKLGEVKVTLIQSGIQFDHCPSEVVRLEIALLSDADLAGMERSSMDIKIPSDQLAYVMFTSGSTGMPKGVMINHQSALNTIEDMNRKFSLSPSDRVLGLSSLSFDLSVYDIFGTLSSGAALVLPHPDRLRDPAHWLELMTKHDVTIWNSVPTFMSMLTTYCRSEVRIHSLRLCLLSGDWIPLSLAEEVRCLNPHIHIVSLGGATEASIWSILYVVDAVDPAWSSIPYGLSMSGQRVHVLNARMEECPVCVPGELYIGGAGVGMGYWKDSSRSNEQFVYSPITGERLYSTGDWGCYRTDGVIEFMGREDMQVKINGYRIEIGEIEYVLKTHPSIRQAVVLVDTECERTQLRAFICINADSGFAGSWEEIKTYVKNRMPGYMVPHSIQIVKHMPLNINGKLDRRTLLDASPAVKEIDKTISKSHLEEQIIEIWRKILRLNHIEADEHFFDIGGNSLKLIQMQAEIQSLLNREIPMVELFRHTTVSMLLNYIDGEIDTGGTVSAGRAEIRLEARRMRRR